MKCLVLLWSLTAAAQPPSPTPTPTRLLFQAATLHAQFKDSEALAKYQEVLKAAPKNYLALWQAAELSVKIGGRYSDDTRKSAYYEAGRAYADRALALRPEGGEANYAAALALFAQATLLRARGRMQAFRDLRTHVVLATERRPDLPEAWELLGRWQYRVAHFNLLERLYFRLFLGGVPPGASNQAAIASLERARQLDPQRLLYCYDLARMLRYQGSRRRAIGMLREAQQITPRTNEELVVSRLCRQMLPRLLRQDARRQKRRARLGLKYDAPMDSAATK